MRNGIASPIEIYIHIPFCVKKCDYCDFLSGSSGPEEQSDYVQALLREIDAVKEGKKRMRQVGNVEIPQKAFMSVLKLDDK